MDAFNVDLKSFDDGFYRRMAGGMLAPVLETLRAIVAGEKHLEITFLVIPTLNDSEEEFLKMIGWISSELGSDIPLHLSRYFPAWKLHLPPLRCRYWSVLPVWQWKRCAMYTWGMWEKPGFRPHSALHVIGN